MNELGDIMKRLEVMNAKVDWLEKYYGYMTSEYKTYPLNEYLRLLTGDDT